jgi:hypothetical protein
VLLSADGAHGVPDRQPAPASPTLIGMDGARAAGRLAVGQGLFFLAAGAWPILHLRSFEAVTGPKREGWLVKTTGALIAVVGAALLAAGRRGEVRAPAAVLGAGSAAALAAVDLWYAGWRRRISPVYLADAAVELGLVAGWAAVARRVG